MLSAYKTMDIFNPHYFVRRCCFCFKQENLLFAPEVVKERLQNTVNPHSKLGNLCSCCCTLRKYFHDLSSDSEIDVESLEFTRIKKLKKKVSSNTTQCINISDEELPDEAYVSANLTNQFDTIIVTSSSSDNENEDTLISKPRRKLKRKRRRLNSKNATHDFGTISLLSSEEEEDEEEEKKEKEMEEELGAIEEGYIGEMEVEMEEDEIEMEGEDEIEMEEGEDEKEIEEGEDEIEIEREGEFEIVREIEIEGELEIVREIEIEGEDEIEIEREGEVEIVRMIEIEGEGKGEDEIEIEREVEVKIVREIEIEGEDEIEGDGEVEIEIEEGEDEIEVEIETEEGEVEIEVVGGEEDKIKIEREREKEAVIKGVGDRKEELQKMEVEKEEATATVVSPQREKINIISIDIIQSAPPMPTPPPPPAASSNDTLIPSVTKAVSKLPVNERIKTRSVTRTLLGISEPPRQSYTNYFKTKKSTTTTKRKTVAKRKVPAPAKATTQKTHAGHAKRALFNNAPKENKNIICTLCSRNCGEKPFYYALHLLYQHEKAETKELISEVRIRSAVTNRKRIKVAEITAKAFHIPAKNTYIFECIKCKEATETFDEHREHFNCHLKKYNFVTRPVRKFATITGGHNITSKARHLLQPIQTDIFRYPLSAIRNVNSLERLFM